MSGANNAVIFKSTDELELGRDPYVERFEKADIKCKVISVLKFEYTNFNELKEKLQKPDSYAGIIFCSSRCVKAVKMCCENISSWENHKMFVVGEKSSQVVNSILGLHNEGCNCGNAKALAEYILKQNITKPLLLPTSNLSLEILSKKLTEGGVKVDHIIVYKTLPDPNIESNIKETFTNDIIKYVLYFSPSAVDATFPIFNKLGIPINNIKWGAIGPTTQSSLETLSVQVSIVPDSPTPEYFALALEKFLEKLHK